MLRGLTPMVNLVDKILCEPLSYIHDDGQHRFFDLFYALMAILNTLIVILNAFTVILNTLMVILNEVKNLRRSFVFY